MFPPRFFVGFTRRFLLLQAAAEAKAEAAAAKKAERAAAAEAADKAKADALDGKY